MFSINKNIKHSFSKAIESSIIPKICKFNTDQMKYNLDFSKIKKNKSYGVRINKLIDEQKVLTVKGITNKLKNSFCRKKCPEGDKKYYSSNKTMGSVTQQQLYNYTRNKKVELNHYARAIIDHFKAYGEEPYISELAVVNKNFRYCTQMDLITIDKDKKLTGYEIKTFYPCDVSKSNFKKSIYHKKTKRKLKVKDCKLNRSYLQLVYTEKALEDSYKVKLDDYYVLCVYENKNTNEIITERVEHPNWYKYCNKDQLVKDL